ncbi:MAG: LysO family transporter [Massilibacteroides sp.]|nr:LysO family transporter [Massilibacteroides sp.]MDD3063049.1 LysO family transporter [Massilibacteroides sp.]MDD4114174.1 LysO family transporter [Massilibacteroides sp.]MDD4660558.1 LysO family transporter [Massilibacteroides sp.]
MFTIIGIMFGGIGMGYLFRNIAVIPKLGVGISYTIYLLLFLLGISVGTNETIMKNLGTLGVEAFLIAFAGTLGSIFAAWGVYRFFYRKKGVDT